jgi:hypothetical protein
MFFWKQWADQFVCWFGFGKRNCRLRGWPPPNPRPETKDRCAGKCDLSGAKPVRPRSPQAALTLAVPLVSPPTPPTSSAGHAPCGRLGIDDHPEKFAGPERKAKALIAARELVNKTRSLKIAVQMKKKLPLLICVICEICLRRAQSSRGLHLYFFVASCLRG